jgi:hypothetical protein
MNRPRIPPLETLPENIVLFGVLIRSRGMPVGCDSMEPTETLHPQLTHSDFHSSPRRDDCGNLLHESLLLGDNKAF